MSKFDKTTYCSFSTEVVSYLYDEMKAVEKNRFEDHIADCTACIEELAFLSFARLEVYEWQRDVFAHLATPKIAIPFENVNSIGRWEHIKTGFQKFGLPPQWTAAGAFVLIAIFMGLAYFLSNSVTKNDELAVEYIAEFPGTNEFRELEPVIYDSEAGRELSSVKGLKLKDIERASNNALLEQPSSARAEQTPRISIDAPVGSRKSGELKTVPNVSGPGKIKRAVSPAKAPRLNDFVEEEDDTTLRLADLFADADTRD